MQHTYKVTGMTCNNCVATVTESLNAINNITNVIVNLEKQEVTINMTKHIPTAVLQKSLPDKYTISEKKETNVFNNSKDIQTEKTELQQLFPLFLIFTFILGASVLLNFKPWNVSQFMLDFMGIFFIVFSFFKFLDLKGFTTSFKMYDPLAKMLPAYSWVYPFIELLLGILLLMRIEIPLALIITILTLGITTVGVTKSLLSKQAIKCACLGSVLNLPMTKATFIENTIMLIMAITMLIKFYY